MLHKELSEEARVRNRSADLIVRPAARESVRVRADVVRSLRENFHRRGYLEVETPMLQTLHGGAAARPFVTHMNAFDIDLFLRIAPELFLKRAVVGGVERVFEINRNFRNEGADSSHSPEFAMLEAYQAYGDYDDDGRPHPGPGADRGARRRSGTTLVTLADGSEYDLGGQWARIGLYDSLSEALGEEITPQTPIEQLFGLVDRFDLQVDRGRQNHGKLVEELWEHHVGASAARADLRPGLPGRHEPFDARPPHGGGGDREMGPVRARVRARRPAIPSSSTRSSSARDSRRRRASRRPGTTRPCALDEDFLVSHGARVCRRLVEWAWGSTGCSWR